MTEVVLDASVVVHWFAPASATANLGATKLREEYVSGRLLVVVPPLLFLEVLNVAGRRWRRSPESLVDLARRLDDLGLQTAEPDLVSVAGWVARRLTAYDAAYVALADDRRLPLITDDRKILEAAAEIAGPVSS